MVLNLRGVKESVTSSRPIFLPVPRHPRGPDRRRRRSSHGSRGAAASRDEVRSGFATRAGTLGLRRDAALFLRAYSLGGGTYTGIEAVSNGLQIMREPRVRDRQAHDGLHGHLAGVHRRRHPALLPAAARRRPTTGKTLNAVLAERFAGDCTSAGFRSASGFVVLTLVSEARAALRRRAGRLHRRPARHGQHGGRLLAAAPLRAALRAADHAQRRAADGRRRARRARLHRAATSPRWSSCTRSTSSSPSRSRSWRCAGYWWRERQEHADWRRSIAIHVRRPSCSASPSWPSRSTRSSARAAGSRWSSPASWSALCC